MKLFDKINNRIDYNNSFSINKSVSILDGEFSLAVKKQNVLYAQEVLEALKKILQNLDDRHKASGERGETLGFASRICAKRLRSFIPFLTARLKKEFGIKDVKNQILDTPHE